MSTKDGPAVPTEKAPPAKAPAAPPAPSASAAPPPPLDKEAMEMLLKSLEKKAPQMRVPLSSILLGDDRTQMLVVPSAREDADGNEMTVEVKVRDIGDRGLITAYSEAARRDPNEAHAMLWEKCVVDPPELADREQLKATMPRLPTRFKEGLSVRILRANGVEGFLESMSLL